MPDESYRSFRLHRPIPSPPPPRTVGDYAPDELAQFKNAFRPTADRYRRHLRIGGVAAWVVFFFIGFAFLLATAAPHSLSFSLVFTGFVLLWVGALWGIVLTRSLKCPACKRQITTLCAYCPECGHSPLAIGWFGGFSCEHCGKTLSGGKRRNYKIKVCSHCGVVLDEQGLRLPVAARFCGMMMRGMDDSYELKTGPYVGMTVNERLFEAKLLEQWDTAARRRDRESMIDILLRVDLSPTQAQATVTAVLSNPGMYGF